MQELEVPNQTAVPDISAQASEDFALIAEQIPSCYMFLAAGFQGEDVAPVHSPKARFNEGVLPQGAAYLAHCATRWLQEH